MKLQKVYSKLFQGCRQNPNVGLFIVQILDEYTGSIGDVCQAVYSSVNSQPHGALGIHSHVLTVQTVGMR